MRVQALVLNFNNAPYTIECVESLLAQVGGPPPVMVVDNGSTDDSVEVLSAALGMAVDVHALPLNRGVPGGLNAGLRAIEGLDWDAVLIVLNDTSLEPTALRAMAAYLAEEVRLGAVAPVQVRYDEPNVVVSAGGFTRRVIYTASHQGYGAPLTTVRDIPLRSAEWLDFTCVLIRRDALRRVGYLTESYRFYWDDVEWGVRCRRAGFELGVVTEAVIRHRVGGTLGTNVSMESLYLQWRNRFRACRRLHGRRRLALLLLLEPILIMEAMVTRRYTPASRAARLRAACDELRHRST